MIEGERWLRCELRRTHLAIPDVCGLRCLEDKTVVGIEAGCLLLHLDSSRVKLVGASHVEQPSPVHVVAVRVKPVLEGAGTAARVDHHAATEHQEEVVRLFPLHDAHLHRSSTILVVQMDRVECCCTSFVLGRLLQTTRGRFGHSY